MRKFKFVTLLILIAIPFNVAAQEPTYKASIDGWLVDLNEAYTISQKTGKPIIANFTGSDWCGWCHKLKADVFDKTEFKNWSKDNAVLLELDFPRRFQLPENIKQQNYSIQQAFGVKGYPTIWVFSLDKDAEDKYVINAYGKTGYAASATEFIKNVENLINKAKK